jgi:hypothetical protein
MDRRVVDILVGIPGVTSFARHPQLVADQVGLAYEEI